MTVALQKKWLMAAALALPLAGCGVTVPRSVSTPRPALVMASPWVTYDAIQPSEVPGDHAAYAWETHRNDADLGAGARPGVLRREVYEIRTWDTRRTHNGRVSEHSRTRTRSLRRGLLLLPQ